MTRPAAVLLVRHAPTASTRRFRFPADEPLDAGGRCAAEALAGQLPAEAAVTSPAVRCCDTAALAGFPDAEVAVEFAELDFGRWAGRDPHEVGRQEPAALEAWYADPRTAPHDGERLDDLAVRVRHGLERLRGGARTVVFTHGGPVKVAVLLALEAPLGALWRIDVAPCSVTELHARPDGGWTLVRSNAAVAA